MIFSARTKPHFLNDKPSSLRVNTSTTQREEPAITLPAHDGHIDVELAKCILARIEKRLPGRIRHLRVFASDNAIILAGQCSTFYTKQIAQHVAMGVLEYERLINNIDVRVPK